MSRGLTTTSHLILGLIALLGPSTPYQWKRAVRQTIGHFWTFPHSQLYAEPARLVAAGLLKEEREQRGRRRRTFALTEQGHRALEAWLGQPTAQPTEVRDLGLLKLFFADLARPEDVSGLAEEQERAHRQHLAQYRALASGTALERDVPYSLATLRMGLLFEEAAIQFWTSIGAGRPSAAAPSATRRRVTKPSASRKAPLL